MNARKRVNITLLTRDGLETCLKEDWLGEKLPTWEEPLYSQVLLIETGRWSCARLAVLFSFATGCLCTVNLFSILPSRFRLGDANDRCWRLEEEEEEEDGEFVLNPEAYKSMQRNSKCSVCNNIKPTINTFTCPDFHLIEFPGGDLTVPPNSLGRLTDLIMIGRLLFSVWEACYYKTFSVRSLAMPWA